MENHQKLLVVDDDPEIRDLLSRYLTKNGYEVHLAEDSRVMDEVLRNGAMDLIILDIMLPGRDGLEAARDLRSRSDIPIIMLTARGDDTDRIVGLEMGADDYLAKPFNPRELLARVKTVLRRTNLPQSGMTARNKRARFAGWRIDFGSRELVSPNGLGVTLTAGEFDLLAALVEHPQQVLSRDLLLDLTRGRHAGPYDRSIDVQIGRLRRRIETDPKKPRLIKTVRGGGYTLATEVEFE